MATMCIEGFLASKGVTPAERKHGSFVTLKKGTPDEYVALVFPWSMSDQVDEQGEPVTSLFLTPSKSTLAPYLKENNIEFNFEWMNEHKDEIQVSIHTIKEGPRAGKEGWSLCLVSNREYYDFTGW